MSIFEGEERAHETLQGKVSLVSVKRSAIKLSGKPRIVVCVPVGSKSKADTFNTPDGQRWLASAASVPASVPIQWLTAQMNMVPPLCTYLAYLWQWGMLSGEARQILTMQALSMVQEDGYILYWDDDVVVEPLSLYTLYSFMEQHPEAGLVSGVYCTRQEPVEPVVYKEHMHGAYWGLTVGPEAEPEEVMGVGAGFMLARASAVRDMVAKNPGVPIWADSKTVPYVEDGEMLSPATTFGHDVRFCTLMWEAGWKVYVDGRVELGHHDSVENHTFYLPDDSPPKVRGRNVNTKRYWDQVYGREGADTWRRYPEMFDKVAAEVPPGSNVVEIGCGVGVLGSKLAAQRNAVWVGYDISAQAVEMARSRFLNAICKDVKDLHADDLLGDVVVATELVEHLSEPDRTKLLELVGVAKPHKFIWTCPNDCMGPDEVREHQVKFDEALVHEVCTPLVDAGWKLRVEKADEVHLMVVLERGDDPVA